MASGRDDLDPASVLFESDGVPGHSAAGGAPRQVAAVPVVSGAVTTGGPAGLTFCFGGGNRQGAIEQAACLTARGHKCDFEVETFAVQSVAGAISHTLNGRGCSEDGARRGVPIITLAFAQNSRGELRLESGQGHISGALSTGGGKPGQGLPMIASVSLRRRAHSIAAELGNGISPALRSCSGSGSEACILAPACEACFRYRPDTSDGLPWRVRRLMPVECERLQGMPDDYTQVPYRGKPAADAPRYKAIGNSMAVPCVAWLGRRLISALR